MSTIQTATLYEHIKTKSLFVLLDEDDDKLILINREGKKIALPESMFTEVEDAHESLTIQQKLAYDLYLEADNRPKSDNMVMKFEYYSRDLKILCSELIKWGVQNRKLNKFEKEFLESQVKSHYRTLTEKQTRVVFDIFLAMSSAGFELKEDDFDYLISIGGK